MPHGPVAMAAAVPELLRRVASALRPWQEAAAAIPDPELRLQAQASLALKRFHCEGGAAFALAAPAGDCSASVLRFIVALQTISDYLDNLADRSDAAGAADLELLHRAMQEAVDDGPAGDPDRFYRLHPRHDDGGYLAALVAACRAEVAMLEPGSAAAFRGEAARLAGWYSELQVRKHLPAGRLEAVRTWARGLEPFAPGLSWWETAAATGSTLGIFALFCRARAGALDRRGASELFRAYFPWVTGLHILLDYWVDRAEDASGGDMNFTTFYGTAAAAAARLARFGASATAAVGGLPDADFHRTVVRGLPALYLTDPKVARQGLGRLALAVLRASGPTSWILYWMMRWMRAQRGPASAPLAVP